MTVRRVARFRTRGKEAERSSGLKKVVVRVSLRALDLIAISIAILLVAMPFVWRKRKADEAVDTWTQGRFSEMARMEMDWMTLPRLPEFTRGNEPAVREFLEAQPLVLALHDRKDPRSLWIRQGTTLVRAGGTPEARILRGWFAAPAQAQSFAWFPVGALPDEERADPKVILRGDRWEVAKRWKEGSPDVERNLRMLCGPACPYRVILLKDGDENRKDFKLQAWGSEPNIQGDPYRGIHSVLSTQFSSTGFPGWTFMVIPFQTEALGLQHHWRVQFRLAWVVSVTIGAALVLALYLRSRARRQAALDADRMASMTHSLKTPLAILKFRCDTLRLGRLSPDQLDAQLIQIGEETDRLSNIIENALMAIQGSKQGGPQARVTPEWIASVAEDLAPAFEAVNRRLVLACSDQFGFAALPSLRAALLTLVENALFHGDGTVTLETVRTRKRFLIKVSDEGPGLDALGLKTLGRPFMRIRDEGKEGFRKDGQGLGLSLLTKVVEREGWGLTFSSEPDNGLCATLEIQGA